MKESTAEMSDQKEVAIERWVMLAKNRVCRHHIVAQRLIWKIALVVCGAAISQLTINANPNESSPGSAYGPA